MRRRLIVLSLSCVAMLAAQSQALDFSQVLTEGTVGSGSNQTMIVIDWKSGVTPSHAWLYQWDGSATFSDAYNAIESAFGGDFAWSNTAFVTQMDYDDGVDNHLGNGDGWMSFWNSLDGESWQTNNNGVFDELLLDGGWAGTNADGIVGNWPGPEPVAPLVPEPATAAIAMVGMALMLRRRNDRRTRQATSNVCTASRGAIVSSFAGHQMTWMIGAMAVALTTGGVAHATTFADQVVSYDQGANAASGYITPTTALGTPETFTGEGSFPSVVSPFSSPFGTDEIVSIGTGGHLTLRLSHYVIPQAGGPEIGVFTNFGLMDVDWPNGVAGDPASGFGDNYAVVEVSEDGQSWVAINGGNDIAFTLPTNGYTDVTDPYATSAGSVLADPSLPFTGNLSDFNGLSYFDASDPDILDLLNGSAGGTWLDISATGLSQVGFIRFSVPLDVTPGSFGNTNFELDAVSVAANAVGSVIPEPGTLTLATLVAGLVLRRRQLR